jgi:formylmethanofuran:tetrahydromethanopterin formyltransferase
MDKKKTMIAAVIGGAALIGGIFWYRSKNKTTATTATTAATATTATTDGALTYSQN